MRTLFCSVTAAALLISGCASATTSESNQSGESPATLANEAVTTTAAPATTTDVVESTTTLDATTTPASTTTTSTTEPPESTVPLEQLALELDLVVELEGPVGLAPRVGSDDLFAAEQEGRLRRISADGSTTTILDIGDEVSGGNEQGLLGLAFDPSGTDLYINFTDRSGATVVQRLLLDGDEVVARETIIDVDQLRSNHNGGHLAFGPDGYLYIGLGDGGGGGDPGEHGQNPTTLLGSMLRIDVSAGGEGYAIPPDNPFANGGDGAPEVFMWGLRNPWRYAFDDETGDLWIGDVGQDRFEEISVVRSTNGGGNGVNLGWNQMEGVEPYRSGVEPDDHTGPVVAYAQSSNRCSVTGGDVYRDGAIASLAGTYVFGDFCTGEIWGIDAASGGDVVRLDIPIVPELTSFGVDNDGELYVLSRQGEVFRIVAA